MATVTIVSAYYIVPSKHSPVQYKSWITNFLKVQSPIVLFVSPEYSQLIRKLRGGLPLLLIEQEFQECYMWKTYEKQWNEQLALDEFAHVGHSPELYAIWANKHKWVIEAIQQNPFNTSYFVWCDSGAFREEYENPTIYLKFPQEYAFTPGKILCLAVNSCNSAHSSNIEPCKCIIGGGIWGGDMQACETFSKSYEKMLNVYFNKQIYAGSDQNIMASLTREEPGLFTVVKPHDNVSCNVWFFLKYLLSGLYKDEATLVNNDD